MRRVAQTGETLCDKQGNKLKKERQRPLTYYPINFYLSVFVCECVHVRVRVVSGALKKQKETSLSFLNYVHREFWAEHDFLSLGSTGPNLMAINSFYSFWYNAVTRQPGRSEVLRIFSLIYEDSHLSR